LTATVGIGDKGAGRLMFTHKIKRLPLTKGGRIAAMVTARDLVAAIPERALIRIGEKDMVIPSDQIPSTAKENVRRNAGSLTL